MTTPTPAPPAGEMTRTCQNHTDPSTIADPFTTAGLVAALEQAWAAIRSRHPQVPAAVIVVGSGSPAKASQAMKWGHFADARWQHGDEQLPEVLVSGEGLSRTPAEVFTTLLHEATHGLATARGIKDTSRQGRWHNKHFATLAAELGMTTVKDDKLGFSPCTLTEQTTADYRPVIDSLATALRVWRHPEVIGDGKGRTSNNNGVTAECQCPRKIRVSVAVFDAGPIRCDTCGEAFLPEDIDRDQFNTNNPAPGRPSDVDTPATDHNQEPDEEDDPMVFYDPTGARYGLPTYPYKFAPDGLLTVRQLRARGLRPGGQQPAAQILWRRGKRVAYLYRIEAAKPKRTATAAQTVAIGRALLARRTCPTCFQVKDYYIPRRHGECFECAPVGVR